MHKIDTTAVRRFLAELRRRKVVRVAAVYAVVAWVVIQIAANTFPALHLPQWALTLVVVMAILGFPIALVLAWSLELTPDGIRSDQGDAAANARAPAAPAAPAARVAVRSTTGRRAPAALPVISVVPADEPANNDPTRRKRAVLATLRHDLRTPMNAILGYSEVLLEEAEELGIAAMVDDVQRVRTAAKRLLEEIDVHLPSGIDVAEADPEKLRARLHEALLDQATGLLEQGQQLLARATDHAGAAADVERIVSAAQKLVASVRNLTHAAAPSAENSGDSGFERVLRRAAPSTRQSGALQAGTLLVVDDNALNRDLLTRQLVREGYNVFTAASGKEALEKLRLHDVDLVLLDVLMPEMDGMQVLEAIQQDAVLREIPVVMISALDEVEAVARCIERGAVDYLVKPFDPVLLRARIATTLQLHQLRGDVRHLEGALEESRACAAQLAGSVAPGPFSAGIGSGERAAPVHYGDVSAVVVRLEALDAMASRSGAGEMVARVGNLLTLFDERTQARGCAIARATGRSFMVLVGAPEWHERHAESAAELALDLLDAHRAAAAQSAEQPWIRIGVHSGTAIAGIAGLGDRNKIVFGLWGDAVSVAEAIASQASAGQVQVSASTAAKLNQRFQATSPAMIEVPGQGHLRTFVLGREAAAVRPAAPAG